MTLPLLQYSHPPPPRPNLFTGSDPSSLLMLSRGSFLLLVGITAYILIVLCNLLNQKISLFNLVSISNGILFFTDSTLLLGTLLCAFPRFHVGDRPTPAATSRSLATICLAFPPAYDLIHILSFSTSLIHPSRGTFAILYTLSVLGKLTGLLALLHFLRAYATELTLDRTASHLKLAFLLYAVGGTLNTLLIIGYNTYAYWSKAPVHYSPLRHQLDLGTHLLSLLAWLLLATACWSLTRAFRRTAINK